MRSRTDEENAVSLPFFGVPKLLPYIKRYVPRIIVMVMLGMFASLIDSAVPLMQRYALDHFVVQGTLQGLKGFVILYVAMMVVYMVVNFFTTYLCGQVEMSVDRDLRNAAFNHLQELSFSYFNQNNVGYIHARVMSDTGKIEIGRAHV